MLPPCYQPPCRHGSPKNRKPEAILPKPSTPAGFFLPATGVIRYKAKGRQPCWLNALCVIPVLEEQGHHSSFPPKQPGTPARETKEQAGHRESYFCCREIQHHMYTELVVSSPPLPATNVSSLRQHNISDCTFRKSSLPVKLLLIPRENGLNISYMKSP